MPNQNKAALQLADLITPYLPLTNKALSAHERMVQAVNLWKQAEDRALEATAPFGSAMEGIHLHPRFRAMIAALAGTYDEFRAEVAA